MGSPLATATRLFPPATLIVEPATGGYRVVTSPTVTPIDSEFRFVSEDGTVAPNAERVPAGARVMLVGNNLPGLWRFAVNDVLCAGSMRIEAGKETRARIDVARSGTCQLTVVGDVELFP